MKRVIIDIVVMILWTSFALGSMVALLVVPTIYFGNTVGQPVGALLVVALVIGLVHYKEVQIQHERQAKRKND